MCCACHKKDCDTYARKRVRFEDNRDDIVGAAANAEETASESPSFASESNKADGADGSSMQEAAVDPEPIRFTSEVETTRGLAREPAK